MNSDPRVLSFLRALRADLGEFFPAREADERVREIAGHLEQTLADHAQEPDPVAAALAEFGDAHGYRQAAEQGGRGLLLRLCERKVVRLAALVLLVPIGLDLLMDASSWLTWSDSSTAALSVPLTLGLALAFCLASTRSRRFLFAPITLTTMACFALFLIAGGWTRAADDPGGIGTRTRGTAFRRREGLIRDTLPEKEARRASLERAAALFARPKPTIGIGEFRVASGYLTPTIPDSERAAWKGDPRGSRWIFDSMRYEPVADYAAARSVWRARTPEMLRDARLGVEGERQEIAELKRVVDCPWSASVEAQIEPKATMFMVTLPSLLLLHGLGVASGALVRHRRRRRLA